MNSRYKILLGVILTIFYLIFHIFIMNDYGISWDFHYHNFAGLYHLGQKVPSIDDSYSIPFTPPDPRLTTLDPFGPFTQIIPTLSYLIFYDLPAQVGKLPILPFDSAYNLPSVVLGSLGILVLFLFLYEAINFPLAIFSSVFLALLPTHFGYLHDNMKDVPNAFVFTLSVYLFWRLTKHKRLRDLIWAILAFAFAFNVKINSVMIPVVCLVWFLFKERKTIITVIPNLFRNLRGAMKRIQKDYGLVILYFILSPIAALLIWWPFWKDPIGKLLELPYFYSHNTLNMPVLLDGVIYHSGVNIPWFYPWVYIFITTPLGVLTAFLMGIIISITKIFKKNGIYALLIIWLLIPLMRYFSPKVSAIDGMRHFMEVVYPLCALAGVGFYFIYETLDKLTKSKKTGRIIFGFLLITLVYNLVKFHPYQTSFYNAAIGGVKGANGKFDIDFWGAPQKDAIVWLNKNAEINSYINVVMAQSSAAMYARTDFQSKINEKDWENSDYTVILNKKSFFEVYPIQKYLSKSLSENKLVYERTIDGVPLFWVIKN
ncbi:glycosyltransferase family 39 protein [Candidatus Gottesmanbacteria bacterium]|nr:glycosyltransferase family 39 protein [Candidatus Gottesmanbacteria bacterium]